MEPRNPDDLDALRAASDVLAIDALLSDAERAVRDEVRGFVDERISPGIADWFDRAVFPLELVTELGALGVLGMHLAGLWLPGRSRRRVRPRRHGARGGRLRHPHVRRRCRVPSR